MRPVGLYGYGPNYYNVNNNYYLNNYGFTNYYVGGAVGDDGRQHTDSIV